jgi:hypothetical protein
MILVKQTNYIMVVDAMGTTMLYENKTMFRIFNSVVEQEPHHFVAAVMRCGSGPTNGIKHGKELENHTI